MVKVNHRKEFNPEMVKEQLGIAREKMDNYKTIIEFLGSKRYTTERLVEYLNKVYPSNIKDEDIKTHLFQQQLMLRTFEVIETHLQSVCKRYLVVRHLML